ncbi:SlyX family protein [Xanthobacteraceae bacterium Astr-EGSB]|jgi:SlyX protein|uniref:SlyX family protein n=1 Tax=Astrobacterium formosum TaxID=3069710 RepID=UPI0027AE44B7|nr:SlyX family protein [Xanthobacteraceae bacterium Astr-EGSB]
MDDDLAERVATLEARVAYQDRTIEDLDKAATAQWAQIDALTREVARLAERLQQAEDRRGEFVPEPPPPHY